MMFPTTTLATGSIALSALNTISSVAGIDWIIFGGVFAIVAFETFRVGPSRAASVVLAIPTTQYIIGALHSAFLLAGPSSTLTTNFEQVVLFAVIYVVSFLIIQRMTFSYGDVSGSLLQAVIGGVFVAVMIAVTWSTTPFFVSLLSPSPLFLSIFSASYTLWWFVASLVVLAFIKS